MTAEFAVALPAVLIVLAASLGALHLGAEQVRAVATASIVARAEARGDDPGAVQAALAADPGARIGGASDAAGLHCVTVDEAVMSLMPPIAATGCALQSAP